MFPSYLLQGSVGDSSFTLRFLTGCSLDLFGINLIHRRAPKMPSLSRLSPRSTDYDQDGGLDWNLYQAIISPRKLIGNMHGVRHILVQAICTRLNHIQHFCHHQLRWSSVPQGYVLPWFYLLFDVTSHFHLVVWWILVELTFSIRIKSRLPGTCVCAHSLTF